jgi:sugar lactone lactonase YvrE
MSVRFTSASLQLKASHIAGSLGALGALLCATQLLAADAPALPASIKMSMPGIVPEGVEYDTKNQRFLVGSLAKGTVFIVANDGTLTPFIQDPDLKSSVGIEVDEERNRLLVPNSDSAVFGGQSAGQAKLGIYDLTSGKRLAMVDLAQAGPKDAKAHFANDVTVGSDGSAYVTDTMARVVYKVDPKYKASVFLPNTFADIKAHSLNGIVYHPSGYLLVAESVTGDLYKVPLEKPGSFTKVKLPEQPVGADGMVWHPDGRLVVVRNDQSRTVIAFKSTDNWVSATVDAKGTFGAQATTAAVTSDGVYVVEPSFADEKVQPVIERVHLE